MDDDMRRIEKHVTSPRGLDTAEKGLLDVLKSLRKHVTPREYHDFVDDLHDTVVTRLREAAPDPDE